MRGSNNIPVYVFTGFLESGKTRFIKEVLGDPDFTDSEKTLLIQCEEGLLEFTDEELSKLNTTLVTVQSEADLSAQSLKGLERQLNPDRVMVEYNGMWKMDNLIYSLPANWPLYQIVTTVNAQTYTSYSQNIGGQMFEHLSSADVIVFNRCTEALKEELYAKDIRAMNPRATIFLDDMDGNTEDYNQNLPLPYDIEADVIEISDDHYGRWYVDAMGEPDKYAGKTVRFNAMVYHGSDVPAGAFVPGRFGMVCCADDVSFIGFICRYEDAASLKVRDWVEVEATITVENLPEYRGAGPVLHATKISEGHKPTEEMVYFN